MTETVVLAAGLAALFAERGARSIRRERALGAWPRPQGPVGVGESLLHHRGAAVPIAVGFVVFTLWGPLAGVAAVPGVATVT